MSRGGYKINRDTSFSSYKNEDPSWVSDYLDAVEKYSVYSRKDDASMFEKINQILGNGKSKYSSVEEAVTDMQKRTGLYDLLHKNASNNIELFTKIPALKSFIDNHISTYPGTSMDAVVFNIMKIPAFKNNINTGEDVPSDVKEYISQKIGEINPEKEISENTNLGKADVSIDNETMKSNNPLNNITPVVF